MTKSPVFCVVGLGYGDEAKGSCVEFLCRKYGIKTVVKYSGGCQSSHNVVTPDGKHFTFSQIGAGAAVGAETIIGPDFLFSPDNLWREKQGFYKTFGFEPVIRVHEHACIVTPYHVAANRIAAERMHRHNTCGMGIGYTRKLARQNVAMRASDLMKGYASFTALRQLTLIRDVLEQEIYEQRIAFDHSPELIEKHWPQEPVADVLDEMFNCATSSVEQLWDYYHMDMSKTLEEGCVFEGGQGALLSENICDISTATWSNTTTRPALDIIGALNVIRRKRARQLSCEPPEDIKPVVIGCLRWYGTRHGEGKVPNISYDPAYYSLYKHELHNQSDGYQGAFRTFKLPIGEIDKAIKVCKPDFLSVSHLDLCPDDAAAEYANNWPKTWPSIGIVAHGPTAAQRAVIAPKLESLLNGK